MVKLIFLCRRRSDSTHGEYAEHLLKSHVPLALRHHPGLRRYLVNIVDRSALEEAELDSIGELSFDTIEDYRERLYDSVEGRQIIGHDVARFMGHADGYVTTEHVQKDSKPRSALGSRSPGVKMICPIMRKPGLSHAEFVDHWLNRHVPLALRHHVGMVKYVTNVVTDRLRADAEPWDGIAELHFPSMQALATGMFDSPAGERAIRADIDRFIGRTGAYFVGEYVQR